jgi:hypothetical protein
MGGAHIADVEYPASALGTPYPLNIKAVRDRLDQEGFERVPISTNIGEEQTGRSNACQAAVGVALAGADYVKCGLAGLAPAAAQYLGRNLVRSVHEWFPKKRVYPVLFPDDEFAAINDPLNDGPTLVRETQANGLLIDTFRKDIGKGLLDYYSPAQIADLVGRLHDIGAEAWVAGSVSRDDLLRLWPTGVDVVCVRGAACEEQSGLGRFGEVRSEIVAELVSTQR